MMKYVLAIDVGASGGRHILGHLENGKLVLEEVYRFDNGMTERGGHLCWRLDRLYEHILKGMAECKKLGKTPVSVGIDTWGVDYVLLDAAGNILGDTIAYRDSRTQGMDAKLEKTLSFEELYARVGIAKQPFNTLYQLMATPKEQLDAAVDFLMVPDYLHYLLTGVKANEYTNASTTSMLDPVARDWDREVLAKAGIPERIFRKPVMPGTRLGALRRATFTYCQHSSRYAAIQRGEILNAFNPALGNCALLDLGVYCAGMMVWLLGAPEGVLAKSAFLHNGFEAQGTVVAWYPGLLAELRYSKIADGDNGCELQGERGLLRMQGLRNPMRVELLPRGGGCEVLWEGEEPQLMRYVLREFVRRVRTSEPDALAMQVMTVLDAVRAASGIVL